VAHQFVVGARGGRHPLAAGVGEPGVQQPLVPAHTFPPDQAVGDQSADGAGHARSRQAERLGHLAHRRLLAG
jgi:hypothetical protein